MSTDLYPSPETAYAEAPSISREIGWVARQVADRAFGQRMEREFWLRKAAVLDRIALVEEITYAPDVAADALRTAAAAALQLAEVDDVHGLRCPDHSASYRPYVRQQYLAWFTDEA